jgi:hypothetical protein
MKHAAAQPRPVSEAEIERKRAEVGQLEEALHIGPAERARYATAKEQLDDLEARLADQQQAAAVEAIRGDLAAIAAMLAGRRDKLSATLAELATVLAEVFEDAAAVNAAVADAHQLLDGIPARRADGTGSIGDPFGGFGARIDGVAWLPVPVDGIVAHVVRAIASQALGTGHPLGRLLEHHFRPAEVEDRPDGLRMPPVPSTFTLQAPAAPAWPAPASAR